MQLPRDLLGAAQARNDPALPRGALMTEPVGDPPLALHGVVPLHPLPRGGPGFWGQLSPAREAEYAARERKERYDRERDEMHLLLSRSRGPRVVERHDSVKQLEGEEGELWSACPHPPTEDAGMPQYSDSLSLEPCDLHALLRSRPAWLG